jgi:hypothetical protein
MPDDSLVKIEYETEGKANCVYLSPAQIASIAEKCAPLAAPLAGSIVADRMENAFVKALGKTLLRRLMSAGFFVFLGWFCAKHPEILKTLREWSE